MSDTDQQDFKFPVIPVLIFIIVVLLLLVVVQFLHSPNSTQSGRSENTAATSNETRSDQTKNDSAQKNEPEYVLSEGQEYRREKAISDGVRLVPPEEAAALKDIEGIKIAVQKDRVYDSILKWNIVGKVEDKNWALRKIVNMVYIAEAVVVQTVEENDGHKIVVLYDFQSVKSFKALYELDSIKLDFMEGASEHIRTTSSILAPLFDLFAPGTGVHVRLAGAVLAIKAKPVMENLALQGYRLVFDANKADEQIKMFAQVNSLEGKKVRVTHEKGTVARIVPVGCVLTASERNFCMNLGVLANYHLMPQTDRLVGEKWIVNASHFANLLEPTLRGVPSGALEIRLKERQPENGRDIATLEITKGVIELDSSDAQSSRVGKCIPKGTLQYDTEERYVVSGSLKADFSMEKASKNHLLFETRFKTNPRVVIEYQCSKSATDRPNTTRFPQLEKEKMLPVPVELFSPFSWD